MDTAPKGYNLTTTVNNLDVSYDDLGEGATPIIFLHGFPFDKTTWNDQLECIKGTNRAIACDLRGFGKSKDEDSALSIDLFAYDLIKFMDKLHIDKAIVCGLSIGGYVALNAITRFPNRFAGLILCDTQCLADSVEAKEKRYKIIDEIVLNGATSFKEGFIQSVFHKDSLLNKKELVDALGKLVFFASKHSIVMGLTAIAERKETCSALHRITVPTLVLCGKEDTITPLGQSKFMNIMIDGSILHILENAGHVSNLEQPQTFNKHLVDFLASLSIDGSKQEKEKPISIGL